MNMFASKSTKLLRMILAGSLIMACSCGRDKNEKEGNSGAAETQADAPMDTMESVAQPPPPKHDIVPETAPDQAVLVVLANGGMIHGAIVPIPKSAQKDSIPMSTNEYYLMCAAPQGENSVNIVKATKNGVQQDRATLTARLPSGLSIYKFFNQNMIEMAALGEIPATASVSAIRLRFEQEDQSHQSAQDMERLRSELQLKEEALNHQLTEMRRNAHQQRVMSQAEMAEQRREQAQVYSELRDLKMEQNKLIRGPVSPRIKSLTGTTIAAAKSLAQLEEKADALKDTLLVSMDGVVVAIRHENRWVELKREIDQLFESPVEAEIQVTGSTKEVSVSCQVHWPIHDLMSERILMVATTTFELESIQGASIDERLKNVQKVDRPKSSGFTKVTRNNIPWTGSTTDLWIKLYRERDNFQQPFVDEKIQLTNSNGLHCRWAKPPSANIRLPKPRPDQPENLVKERSKMELAGNVLDLVPAGDGSMVMVRSDQPPYWQPLNLKSPGIGKSPWQASAETLLAAQAGKVYLLHPESQLLEVWDVATMKQVDAHVLQLEGKPVSIAAPLVNPEGLVMVATNMNVHFLDPGQFDPVSSNLNVAACYNEITKPSHSLPSFFPESIRLRCDNHGRIYTLGGVLRPGQQGLTDMVRIECGPLGVTSVTRISSQAVSPELRDTVNGFPDHGGSKMRVTVQKSYSSTFPAPTPSLIFQSETNHGIATMNNPPVAVDESDTAAGSVPPDRKLYLDAGRDLVLMPDTKWIHVLKVDLPNQNPALPEYYHAGELVKLPRPPGTGHSLTANIGGEMILGDDHLVWKPENVTMNSPIVLNMAWKGELGSDFKNTYNFYIRGSARNTYEVVSPDGSKRLALKNHGMIPSRHNVAGLAGSGNVVLLSHLHGDHEAWNLHTCERLVFIEGKGGYVLGDANRVYVQAQNGSSLTSYDLSTGKELKQMSFGTPKTAFTGLTAVGTGYASTLPLIAIESEGNRRFVELLDRNTLNPSMVSFPMDVSPVLYSCRGFMAGATGDILWSGRIAMIRKGKDVSFTQYNNDMSNGMPDASGRFIINDRAILDIGTKPEKIIEMADIVEDPQYKSLNADLSGKYFIVVGRGEQSGSFIWSFREIQNPRKELLKVLSNNNTRIHFISDAGKLLIPVEGTSRSWGVYDFNMEQLIKQLGP